MRNLLPAATLAAALATQPCLADRNAVEACRAAADKEISRLNSQMRLGYAGSRGERLRDKHRAAQKRRAACEKKKHEPPSR